MLRCKLRHLPYETVQAKLLKRDMNNELNEQPDAISSSTLKSKQKLTIPKHTDKPTAWIGFDSLKAH